MVDTRLKAPIDPTHASAHFLAPVSPMKRVGEFWCINIGGFGREFPWGIFFGALSHKMNKVLAWLPLQSLAVNKKLFFVQILGGEKLLKFVEKCR